MGVQIVTLPQISVEASRMSAWKDAWDGRTETVNIGVYKHQVVDVCGQRRRTQAYWAAHVRL